MTRSVKAFALAVIFSAMAQNAYAWGATGHRMIAVAAVKGLGPDLPAFLKTPQALAEIGELSRELDRSKGAGRVHDTMRDPAHFINLDDAARVSGVLPLEPLAPTRNDFETALRAAGSDGAKSGFLPYAIIDGWQQLTKDLAYWRALNLAIPRAKSAQQRAWLNADLARRQALILSDLGALAHYVGDASQPLHVTQHYNGWGDGPNPKAYTQSRTLHSRFEGQFVRQNIDLASVRGVMPGQADCGCSIEQAALAMIRQTHAEVEPLYVLEQAGGLNPGDARGKAFVTARLAAGAASLRDMVTMAWQASKTTTVGWPAVSLADIEAGKVDAFPSLIGED